MAAKKKYYESMNSGNESWFGVSEGDNGLPPREVIERSSDPYSGENIYYEQGMKYQDKQQKEVEQGVKKMKLNRHF